MTSFETEAEAFLKADVLEGAETVTWHHADGDEEAPWVIHEQGQADETGEAVGWGDGAALSSLPVEGDQITRTGAGESDPWRVVAVMPVRAGLTKVTLRRAQPR